MAQPSSALTGFSLTGNLGLYQKGLFKGVYRNYWFWFDEQTCCLKYYKCKDTYILKVNEPLGCIDLRYAKVTPGIAGGKTIREFQISVRQQMFVLSAENVGEALNWIEKLQEKRSEYIKMSSAMEENAQEQEKERKTLRPLNTKPGSVLGTNEQHDTGNSPPSVRKIFNTRLHGSYERQPVNLELLTSRSERASTTSSLDDTSSPMDPDQRRRLELETSFLESQTDVARLQKELLKASSLIDAKDKELSQLRSQVSQLKEEIAKLNKPESDLQLENDSLKDVLEQYKRSLKTLDEEINLHRMTQTEHDRRVSTERLKLSEMEKELLSVKAKYVKLFSDKFKPTIQSASDEGADDPGEESSNNELVSLLKQESGDNPLFKGYRESFEDHYGDIHDWQSGVSTQLYLCRQLYLHYSIQENDRQVEEWVAYLSQVKRTRGKQHLELPSSVERSKKRELRNLLRKGLPIQFRTKVWSSLIFRVIGKVKEVRDSSAGKDTSYYQSLIAAKHTSSSDKQIRLDLYRTLPSNRHFKLNGNGAPKLENVLLAYSLHNKNVGYCQGMNMLAAMGLLFVDEEMDFWFLVAVIDKLMPPHYFSPGLLAAQADQAVVRELVSEKLPRLHAHLQRHSIDVTLVTFNWFLTLFVDALPTETVLRILDCFLLEGEKVLFRMSLGILKINERKVLSLTDPVALFQFLKEVARHTYDVEALFQAAFVDLNPFPSRHHLTVRHQHHIAIARDQWTEREKQRASHAKREPQNNLRDLAPAPAVTSLPPTPVSRRLVWECGCVRGEGEVWMCCTENQDTHVTIIKQAGKETFEVPVPQVGSRVICMFYVAVCDMILLGTLDFYVHALDCSNQEHLWSIKLNDSVLAMSGSQSDDYNVFAAMADGCVAVIQAVSHSSPEQQALLLRVGSNAAVQCLALNPTKHDLWCGCGKAITVMSTETFEAVQSLVMPDQTGKVYKMERGKKGIWVSFRNSCLVCLYDQDVYVQLLQVDYTTQVPRDNILPLSDGTTGTHKGKWEYRVTSLLVDNTGHLWIGTGSGTLYTFSVAAAVANPNHRVRALLKQTGMDSSQSREFRDRLGSGGLLSSVVAEEDPEQPSHLDRRRKTTFGRTFRGGGRKTMTEKGDSPGVYKIKFVESHQPLSSTNESVRTLVDTSEADVSCVLSCVNSPSKWTKGIQFWKFDSSTGELFCDYLSQS